MADIFHIASYAANSEVFAKHLRKALSEGQGILRDYLAFSPSALHSNTYKPSITAPAPVPGIRGEVEVIHLSTFRPRLALASPLDRLGYA